MANKSIHKIKKITGWILLCLFIIIIAASIFVYLKAPSYLNNNLSELVLKKTKGTYNLQFDNLNLSLIHWGFTIENVNFQPVDSVINIQNSSRTDKVYYSFSSPKINIKNVKILKLLLKKELEIEKFEILTPDLKISGSPVAEKLSGKNLDFILRELAPLVRKKLYSISIHNIELLNANYNFYNLLGDTGKVSNAGQITIGIKNFYTDSVLLPDPNRFFDAEDVFVKMTDYKNRLSDSLHILSAEELYYSLKKEHITGKNVNLEPIKNKPTLKNKYVVKVPFVKLKSKHIHEFHTSDSILIDSLYLDKAEIEFYPKKKSKRITLEHISDFDLYELVSNDFKSVAIGNFILDNAHLKLFNYRDNYYLQQEMKQINLQLKEFYLDSVSIDNNSKIFYSDHLSISINDYQLNLGDNLHRFAAKRLYANTYNQSIIIKQAQLRPISESSIMANKKIAIRVDCDSIKIKGADMKQAFHFRRLPIGGIEIFKPETSINRYDTETEKIKKSSSLVYEMISEYLLAVYANIITLENGQLLIKSIPNGKDAGYIQSGINFQLTDFALDSVSAAKTDKIFFATNIELAFSKYKMQLVDQIHQMTIDKIDISTLRKRASIEQLHLFPTEYENAENLLKEHGNSELYEVKVPYLYFLNTDIHQAFFNKKLTIGNFRIIEPNINFESFAKLKNAKTPETNVDELYKLLSNYINDFDIRHIEVKEGEIKLTNHNRKGKTIGFDNKFNLLLEKFRLNKNEIGKRKLLFSENIDLRIKKYLFRLSDHVHYLQAGEIGISTFDSRVYVNDAILYPDITNPEYKKMPWNVHVSIPSVSLSGVDLLNLYFDGKLLANKLKISSPEIKLYKVSDTKKNLDIKEFSLLLPEKLKELSISKLQMHGGKIQLLKEISAKHEKYLSASFEMKTNELKIENDTKSSKVTSGILSTTLNNLWIEPVNKNQRISINTINYSTDSKKIRVKDLSIAPKIISPGKNQYKLQVPEMLLNSFDIDLAYTKNQYFFEQIKLSKPEFSFYRNTIDSTSFNPYTFNLFPYFKDFANVFSSKQLILDQASFEIIKKNKTIRQEGIDLRLTEFRVDKNQTNQFLSSGNFEFSLNNVIRHDPKRLYQFKFNKIKFSSDDNNFIIQDIHIEPQYSKRKFQQIIGHQLDYFNGNLKEIRFENMDLQRWFSKRELVGKRLLINELDLDIFRDKRIPFNEKQRPPMPQDLIRNFNLKFYFDSLLLNNSNISYAEQIEESPHAGIIDFKNINARLKPLSNIIYLNNLTGSSQLDVTGKIMGGPLITAQIKFDILSPVNSFELKGNIEPFPMNILNPVTKGAALMEVNSGQLEKFEFYFTGDNEHTKGRLKFAYDDLKISILEVKDGNTKKSKFSSFMANNLMIKSKNPRGKFLLPDEINYKRDPSRSILNYWWKSIFSGAKNTFGIKDKNNTH